MKNQIKREESCCPLLERGEKEAEAKCHLLLRCRGVIQYLESIELSDEELQNMCGG